MKLLNYEQFMMLKQMLAQLHKIQRSLAKLAWLVAANSHSSLQQRRLAHEATN